MANKEGVYNILINIITSFQENPSVCLAALKCMVSLMDGQPDILRKEDTLLFNKSVLKMIAYNRIVSIFSNYNLQIIGQPNQRWYYSGNTTMGIKLLHKTWK